MSETATRPPSLVDFVDRIDESARTFANVQAMVGALGYSLQDYDPGSDPDAEHPRGYGLILGGVAKEIAEEVVKLEAISKELLQAARDARGER